MKIYRITSRISFAMLVVMLLTTSCSDYLEEQPSTSIDAGYVFNTEDGLESGVVSLYNFYRQKYEYRSQDFLTANLLQSRNDLNLSRTGYLGLVGRYERAVSATDYGTTLLSNYVWNHYYRITSKATEIINAAEALDKIDDDVKNKIIAQAKFFRAESYFTLYRMFNNIYVTTKTVNADNAFDVIEDKSSEEEIFNLINSDLSFAIEHLEWTDAFGRVTKGTAKHVKAKVAMWQKDWAEAKYQSESLINEGPHSLVSSTADVFKGDMNNSEQLFVVQYEEGVTGGSAPNMINANYLVKYWKADDPVTGSGSDFKEEYGGVGFARLLPNHYLLGLLAEDPNDTRDDNTYFRLKYYFDSGIRTGEEIDVYKPVTYDPDTGEYIPSPTYKKFLERLNPACLKFANEKNDPTTYWQINNIMIYRLAETYLIAAEANMRGGGDPLPYINAVRERAGAAPLTFVDEKAILDERARELAFEGQRWFTLKRMGQSVINHQMRTYSGEGPFVPAYYGGSKDPRVNWKDHYINFPIPQINLDLMGNNYPQNDGY
jgi:hypothetical protein